MKTDSLTFAIVLGLCLLLFQSYALPIVNWLAKYLGKRARLRIENASAKRQKNHEDAVQRLVADTHGIQVAYLQLRSLVSFGASLALLILSCVAITLTEVFEVHDSLTGDTPLSSPFSIDRLFSVVLIVFALVGSIHMLAKGNAAYGIMKDASKRIASREELREP